MLKRLSRLAPLLAALAGCGGGTSSHHATTTQKLTPGPTCPGYVTAYGCAAHSPSFGLPPKGFPKLTAPSSVPSREMFDSVVVSTVPANPSAVAGYLSGNWPTFGPLVRAFPRAYHVPVAIRALPVYPSLAGRMVCLDVEPGDATPSEAGAWVRGEIHIGVKPCVYSNLSTMPAVRGSITAAGVARSSYFLWVADWTFHPGLIAGFDAVQWTDHALGRNLDESTVSLAFLGIHPAPKPKPLPVCFTHRMTRFQCNGIKEQIASDQRAESSSNGAFDARDCPLFSQRISWFGTQLSKHPKVKTASRKRALAASRAAYRQRSCSVFAGRASYFSGAITRLKAAN
jgi:hypothetical protein